MKGYIDIYGAQSMNLNIFADPLTFQPMQHIMGGFQNLGQTFMVSSVFTSTPHSLTPAYNLHASHRWNYGSYCPLQHKMVL